MKLSATAVFALLTGLVAGAPAAAQVVDTTKVDTIYRIDVLRIQAARPVTTVGGSSAIELRLDSMVSLPPAPTLGQVMRALPAMHVRTNSRGESEISVRGSESRQVAVLVDGIPLTLGWDARTDVSVIPATAPQEISLVRGLSSILYGPNVLGGIVEIGVGQGRIFQQQSSLHLSSGMDDVGGWAASATASAPFETGSGRWLLRAGAGYRDSPGAPLAGDVVEPVPTDDGLRLNTDSRNADGFVSLRYEANGGAWFSVSGSGYNAERGIAAELGTEDPRLWRYPSIWRTIAIATGGTGFFNTPFGQGDVEASVGLDKGRTEIESYTTRAYDQLDGVETGDDRTLTVRVLGDHTLGQRADLRSAFTYSDILHDADIDGEVSIYQQRLWSLGGETIFRLIDGAPGALSSLRLSLGAAVDGGSTPQTGGRQPLDALSDWGARAGVSAVLSDGNVLLHGGISRRGRFPALRELYSEALNRFEPNPDLTSEHLVATEVGITTRLGSGDLQVVGFHHQLSGAIRRITLESGKRQRVNSDELRSTGIEVLLSQNIGALSLGGDFTLQSVELKDPGAGDSVEPENLPELSGSAHARFPLVLGADGITEARFTGKQFCLDPDSGADRELDAGTWLNAGLSRVFGVRQSASGLFGSLEARVFVENIGDTTLYDQCGLPQPGRLVRFQVRLF